MLAKTAGVKHLVVLINKMDDPTVRMAGLYCTLLNFLNLLFLCSKTLLSTHICLIMRLYESFRSYLCI